MKHKMFEELVPSVLPMLKRHIRLGGHAGIVDHSVTTSERQHRVKRGTESKKKKVEEQSSER